MDLNEYREGEYPEEPKFEYVASEDFRNKEIQRKYNSSKNALLVPGDSDGGSSSRGSRNSKYETEIQTRDGDVVKGYVFKKRRNPTYETYLEETKEIPQQFTTPKFLSKNSFENVAIASYQSSGSTLLRKYLEKITYVITGSDGDTHSRLDKQLKHGSQLLGEGILGHKVWMAQTNFPEEIGEARTMINKAVVITRNPCDAIFSHFNKVITRTIDKKLTDDQMDQLKDCFSEFSDQEIDVWKQFHDYWMVEPLIPTYIVRYEDLLSNPEKVLTDLFKFLLNTTDLRGTLIESLIERETSSENEEYYRQNKPGYSFGWYSEDMTSFMETRAGCTIRRLGYGSDFISPINPVAETGFFENDDDFEESKKLELDTIIKNTKEITVKVRYNYLQLNKEHLDLYATSEYQERVDRDHMETAEINLEAEDLRIRGERDLRVKNVIKKYKDLVRSMKE